MAELITGAIEALDVFINGNYQNYLDDIETDLELTAPPDIIKDEVDLDKYRRDVEIYIVPNEITFDPDTMDGTRETETPIDIYCFIKRDESEILYQKVNYFISAFVKMIFKNPDLGGTIGEVDIDKIRLFQKVEGKPGIKGFRAELKVNDEY